MSENARIVIIAILVIVPTVVSYLAFLKYIEYLEKVGEAKAYGQDVLRKEIQELRSNLNAINLRNGLGG